jgi:hypothetical protein
MRCHHIVAHFSIGCAGHCDAFSVAGGAAVLGWIVLLMLLEERTGKLVVDQTPQTSNNVDYLHKVFPMSMWHYQQ